MIVYGGLLVALLVGKYIIDKLNGESDYSHFNFPYNFSEKQKKLIYEEYLRFDNDRSRGTSQDDIKYAKVVSQNIVKGKYEYTTDGYLNIPTSFKDDYEYLFLGPVEGMAFGEDTKLSQEELLDEAVSDEFYDENEMYEYDDSEVGEIITGDDDDD